MTAPNQPLFIPVILGTARQGRQSEFVVPEYNHAYSGILKHALDSNLKEYIHKAVGICGVSAGPFGGVRMIQSLLPVMRELGLMTIFYDLNFGNVGKLFDESGKLLDAETYVRRFDRFMQELVWMSAVLRYGRRTVSVTGRKEGVEVHHANKPCPETAARTGTPVMETVIEARTPQTASSS